MGVVVGVCCISFLDTTKKSEMLGRGVGVCGSDFFEVSRFNNQVSDCDGM